MTLTKKLREEYSLPKEGSFIPYYFKYYDLNDTLGEPSLAKCRARAAYSLFSTPKPYIYKNDLIAGCQRSLYAKVDLPHRLEAYNLNEAFGTRNFLQNCDHYAPDYRHFIKVGIPGILNEIEKSLKNHKDDPEKQETLENMKTAMLGFKAFAKNNANSAKELLGNDGYDDERLQFIHDNCSFIAENAPETFAQGLQLIWLVHVCFVMDGRMAMAFGRMDQYLYDLYVSDVNSGRITKDKAVELLENVFIKILEYKNVCDGVEYDDVVNICIGGSDVDGNCEVNELSYCILEAVKNCNIPGPNLSARICENTPDEFLDECLKVIGTGLGYPALMNDEVNKKALLRYGYDEEDVSDYCMVGCIENFITGKQMPWSDGRFDTPRYFEYIFHNGQGDFSISVGVNTGELSEIKSMDDFIEKFEKQLSVGVKKYMTSFYAKNMYINEKNFTDPFLSCFDSTCIERGLDMHNGGCKYPSVHGVCLMGVGTTADSLAAIEKVVFVNKQSTLEELRDALDSNFEGYEDLRKKLLAAPKYGNNDPFVDKYAVWFLDYLSSEFDKFKTPDGGGIYVAMAANTANINAGKIIQATPDGRLEREPLSDAASPTYGRDVNGATTTVLSITKPDYTEVATGSVINQKFSPSMFSDEKRSKLLSLIKVYMRKGGQEMQINATSRQTLIDAMEHPEKYENLVVRVSGFSAFYVTLDKDVQKDILNRTQQE